MTSVSNQSFRSFSVIAALVFSQAAKAESDNLENQATAQKQPGPHSFEIGVIAGYKDANLVGFYLNGPLFWNLRPSVEVASRSSDRTRDDGTLSVRNDVQSFLSIGSRLPIVHNVFWGTKFGVGWHELRGRYVSDPADKKRTTDLFYTEFETGVGIWQHDVPAAETLNWIWIVEAGTSLRNNYRPTRVFVTEEGERLRSGGVGGFVRIGVGI